MKFKFNEDKQYNKRALKQYHEKVSQSVFIDIRQFIEKPESELSLLDESSPTERALVRPRVNNQFDRMINEKSSSAVTFTFNSILQGYMTETQLRSHLKNAINSVCFNYEMPIELALIPDIDQAGNFHYHGVVNLPLKYRPSFKRLITKAVGFMKFKYVDNNEGWSNYCYKTGVDYKGITRERVYTEEEVNILGLFIKV